jgi:Tol biopolymer transport system component
VFVHDRKTKKTKRVSVHSSGAEATGGDSLGAAISANGHFVVFRSAATDLVNNDTNGVLDIFVHDRKTRKTRRVSVASNGAQALGGASNTPAISADGRFVAFHSFSDDLVAGDNNGVADVFVHDRKKRKTTRISVSTGGVEGDKASSGAAISGDGRFVAFKSDATNLIASDTNMKGDIFVHDRKTKKTKRVSVRSNGDERDDTSWEPDISANGRYVAMYSFATNLVANETNSVQDVFVRDRKKRKTKRVSVRTNGAQANGLSHHPAISNDGRFVTFASEAKNLVKGDSNAASDVFRSGPLY